MFKYISGIIEDKNQKSIIENGVADHVHIFVGMKPSITLSDLMRDVKNNTTNFINEKKWLHGKFSWQGGYGEFSYSRSQLNNVYQYILNQEKHHKNQPLKRNI